MVTNSNSWPPFSYINADGEPRGLLIDLWTEFGVRNDVEIVFKLVSWQESLDLIRSGGADVHGGLFESGERQEYLDFSQKMKVPLASRLFVSSKLNVNDINDLGAVIVGLTEKGFAQEYIETNHPSVNMRGYPNSKEVVEAAIAGEILAFITDYPAAMYYLHKSSDPSQFRVVETLYTKRLQAAVRDGDIRLLMFVEEGFSKVPSEEVERIIQRWIQTIYMTPDWLYTALIAGFCFLLAGFVGTYILVLRRQVRQRTRELEKLSQTDMLTGLFNRMKIERILDAELYRSQRYGHPVSLIMLDIDFFKQVNDTFGHATGDKILMEFANILQDNVRKSDAVGRWGGEEFLIVCPETDEESGAALAENLRGLVETNEFDIVKRCTSSFGVTEIRPDDTPGKAFDRVDIALYKSKVDGRNRVTVG